LKDKASKFWEDLYRKNIGTLIGIGYRYTLNRALAEDLAHEAFLKAMDHIDSYRGKGSPDAWLRRITINHILQHLRDQRRTNHTEITLPDPYLAEESGYGTTTGGIANLSEADLLATINELPEHHRLVFNLYVVDNCTHQRIAQLLGISPGTSKSHLARARKKLKDLILQKAADKQDKSRKGLLGLLLSYRLESLYRHQWKHFQLPVSNVLQHTLNGPLPGAMIWSSASSIGTIAAICLTGVLVVSVLRPIPSDKSSLLQPLPNVQEVSVTESPSKSNSQTAEMTDANGSVASPAIKNNRTQTATFQLDPVMINENLKQLRMKNLKSLSTMFLATSSLLLSPVAPAKAQQARPEVRMVDHQQANRIPTGHATEEAASSTTEPATRAEAGTFYASKLFWSNEDQELYFRGKVKVDIEKNHFSGEGDFKFLGPIHLLIFNGKKVDPGTYLTLVDHAYKVYRLTAVEAKAKYGDAGDQGAIEIQISE